MRNGESSMDNRPKPVESFTECPYCNGVVADGECMMCGWKPEYEVPPIDETMKGWPDTKGGSE